MRKTIITTLGSVLILATAVQVADAAPSRRANRVVRDPAPISEQIRNANAYAPIEQPSSAPSYGGAISAPAGR